MYGENERESRLEKIMVKVVAQYQIMHTYMNAPNVGIVRTRLGSRECTWAALGPETTKDGIGRDIPWLKKLHEV